MLHPALFAKVIREYRRVPRALAAASGAERADIDACTQNRRLNDAVLR